MHDIQVFGAHGDGLDGKGYIYILTIIPDCASRLGGSPSIELCFRPWTITDGVLVWRVGLLLWDRQGVLLLRHGVQCMHAVGVKREQSGRLSVASVPWICTGEEGCFCLVVVLQAASVIIAGILEAGLL